jgi:hypothetical protein
MYAETFLRLRPDHQKDPTMRRCLITAAAASLALAAMLLVDDRSSCRLTLELVDSQTGQTLPGLVQLTTGDGQSVPLKELINRGQGLAANAPISRWWVLPGRSSVEVPAERLKLAAFSGLETERAEAELDLAGRREHTFQLPLVRFYHAREQGYVAGNTHLHLRKLSKEQADRYLREAPLVDGLDIVYVSYLERAKDDLEYTSNNYTPRDLEHLSTDHVHFGHGMEHRHNFGAYGEGYGHILLLDIPVIIRPVSIGPGITAAGTDAPPLRQGIDEARRQGGKVIWAHNMYGFEDIPNWLTGRVHANNIFDGGTHGSYKESFYRYLNIGLKVPFSTGTDWFIYDFSRVYAMTDKPVTPRQWLDLVAAGKTYISNGPLLEFTADGHPVGSTLDLDAPAEVAIRGRALGRLDFQRIELVRNGEVVAHARSRGEGEGGHFVAELDQRLKVDAPCWLALRTPPPPVASDPTLQERVPQNEYGGLLFAHTSPVYVQLSGRGVFDRATCEKLLAEMQRNVEEIKRQGVFDNDDERRQVLAVYEEGIQQLEQRLAAAEQDGLRQRIKDRGLAAHWIYDDFPRAQAEARRTGKPLLVLFRCVPCQCAEVLDEQVTRAGSELAELEQQFVCVRLVQMKGVDLNYFPFDRDLSFAVLLMNADGTIYGRYGTRATISRTEMTHVSLPSFGKALQRALELHKSYPANKESLAAKRSPPGKYQFAEEMPHLQGIRGPTTVHNCIHCHMAGEGEVARRWKDGALTRSDIWVYPLPENLGLQLDVNDGLLVKQVREGTPAAGAGLRAGDELLAMNGQPLVSQGDIQWVLHHLPLESELNVRFRRGGETQERTLALSGNWRKTDVSWRESLTGIRPGIYVRPISDGERRSKRIPATGMALGVRYVPGKAARAAGLRQGDVILAVDGETGLLGEGDFLEYLRIESANEVALRINRRGQELELKLPLRD